MTIKKFLEEWEPSEHDKAAIRFAIKQTGEESLLREEKNIFVVTILKFYMKGLSHAEIAKKHNNYHESDVSCQIVSDIIKRYSLSNSKQRFEKSWQEKKEKK